MASSWAASRCLAVWLALPLAVSAGPGAAFADAAPVTLSLEGCADEDAREVRRLLALELSERLSDAEQDAAENGLHVRCAGDFADLSRVGQPVGRRLAMTQVPAELRPRLIALAVAELASMPTEAVAPAAAALPEPTAPTLDAATPPPAPPPSEPRFALGLGGLGQITPLRSAGGALAFDARLLRHFAWSARAHYAQGQRAIDLGTLHMTQLGMRTGPELVVGYAPIALFAGLGARVSLLRLRGEASDAETASGRRVRKLVAGPDLHAGVRLVLGQHGFLALELVAFYAMRALRVQTAGGSVRTLRGLYTEATLGGGFAW